MKTLVLFAMLFSSAAAFADEGKKVDIVTAAKVMVSSADHLTRKQKVKALDGVTKTLRQMDTDRSDDKIDSNIVKADLALGVSGSKIGQALHVKYQSQLNIAQASFDSGSDRFYFDQ